MGGALTKDVKNDSFKNVNKTLSNNKHLYPIGSLLFIKLFSEVTPLLAVVLEQIVDSEGYITWKVALERDLSECYIAHGYHAQKTDIFLDPTGSLLAFAIDRNIEMIRSILERSFFRTILDEREAKSKLTVLETVKKRQNLDLAKSIEDLYDSMWLPTELHKACYRKNRIRIKELISARNFQKSDLWTKDRGGWTSLHLCVFNGDVESVATLLDAGADPFTLCDLHHTPLHLACSRGFHDVVNIILSKCRKIHLED